MGSLCWQQQSQSKQQQKHMHQSSTGIHDQTVAFNTHTLCTTASWSLSRCTSWSAAAAVCLRSFACCCQKLACDLLRFAAREASLMVLYCR
jgi:hypothetical protein